LRRGTVIEATTRRGHRLGTMPEPLSCTRRVNRPRIRRAAIQWDGWTPLDRRAGPPTHRGGDLTRASPAVARALGCSSTRTVSDNRLLPIRSPQPMPRALRHRHRGSCQNTEGTNAFPKPFGPSVCKVCELRRLNHPRPQPSAARWRRPGQDGHEPARSPRLEGLARSSSTAFDPGNRTAGHPTTSAENGGPGRRGAATSANRCSRRRGPAMSAVGTPRTLFCNTLSIGRRIRWSSEDWSPCGRRHDDTGPTGSSSQTPPRPVACLPHLRWRWGRSGSCRSPNRRA